MCDLYPRSHKHNVDDTVVHFPEWDIWCEMGLWDAYDIIWWMLSVPYSCGAFLIFCSVFGLAPCLMWRTLKLRVRKDILGEKGITSIPDNCEFTKKLAGLVSVLWFIHFVTYNRINNFNEPLICFYMIKTIMVLSIPAALSLLFGESLLKYLRGELCKESKGLVALMDISGTVSFIGRFWAQLMRYFFILAKMALYLAIVEGTVMHWRSMGGPHKYYLLIYSIPQGALIDLWTLTKAAIGFTVDFINVFFVFYAQIGALAIVIWWLLAALYSTAKKLWDFKKEKKSQE